MKRSSFLNLVIAGLLVTQLVSCSKNPKCSGSDEEKGIIVEAVNINCAPAIEQQEYTVNSDSAYRQLFPGCTVPAIDFNAYTLLGLSASGGCEVKFIREVKRIDDEHKYHYKVTVKECGLCKKLGTSYNWVLVPKLPLNWNTSFETKK